MSNLQEIVDTFDLLDDWDQRYQYLIELGEAMPAMPDEMKTDATHVKPCMSTVHVAAYPDPEQPGHVRFHGDCDTAIIKGVLALLIDLNNGKTPAEIEALDMDEVFHQLHLGEQLSPNRHVGIYAIYDMMKSQAEKLASAEKAARTA